MARTLTLLFTSDIHGYFFPTDYIHTEPRPMGLGALKAGFEKEKDENTLIIDGGDTLQGSPLAYYAAHHDGAALVARMMNYAGYDYVTLGNHDFNYGHETLTAYMKNLNAKVLSANVSDITGEMPLAPSTVRVMPNGLRVGIVGAVSDWVNKWEKPMNLTKIRVTDTLTAVKKAYEEIKDQCDVTVCVYHGGTERDLMTGKVYSSSGENIACLIADLIPFDVLLTGHQHLPIANASWNKSHIVQTPANATHFAKVVWTEGEGAVSRLVPAEIVTDATDELVKLEEKVQAWLDTPVSRLTHALTPEHPVRMALKGTPIANLFNRVQTLVSGSDLSATSLANEVRGFRRSVSVRDVVSTYVYPNTLVVLRITGAQLKDMLENVASYFALQPDGSVGVSEKFLRPKVSHYNYDYISGVYYRFELTRPAGQRVVSLRRNGRPVKADDSFTITVNNYRATGVGGYDVMRDCPHEKEILTEMSEILLDFFAANPVVRPAMGSNYRVTIDGKKAE